MCWYAELTCIVEQNKDCCSKMQDNGVEYIDKMKICMVWFSNVFMKLWAYQLLPFGHILPLCALRGQVH